jgi:hypothetical protein
MRLNDELRARTKRYASAIITFYVALPRARKEVQVVGQQLLRLGTLLRDDCGIASDDLESLLAETNELIAIFVTIVERTKRRNK